jgi:hypothetical protein
VPVTKSRTLFDVAYDIRAPVLDKARKWTKTAHQSSNSTSVTSPRSASIRRLRSCRPLSATSRTRRVTPTARDSWPRERPWCATRSADIRKKITAPYEGHRRHQPEQPDRRPLSSDALREIVAIAREKRLVVFADAIYDKTLYDGQTRTSIASLADDALFVTFNGLSKNYQCCGYRANTRSSFTALRRRNSSRAHSRNALSGKPGSIQLQGLVGTSAALETVKRCRRLSPRLRIGDVAARAYPRRPAGDRPATAHAPASARADHALARPLPGHPSSARARLIGRTRR